MYDRIKILCKLYGISVNKLEQALAIAKGSLCKMNDSKPSVKRAQELADFFYVSVDYLLGKNPDEVYNVEYPDQYDGINQVGEYLKESRERRDLSIKDLSAETGISEKVLRGYENGGLEVKSNLFQKILNNYEITQLDFENEHNIMTHEARPEFDGDYNKSNEFDKAVAADAAKELVTDENPYYLDEEARVMAEELSKNPELHILFDAARTVSKEDLQFVIDMVNRLKKESE